MGTADLPDGVAVGNTGHATWHEDIHDFLAGRAGATNDLDVGGQKITSLATPTADNDAATKLYVDSAAGIAHTIASHSSYEVSVTGDAPLTVTATDLVIVHSRSVTQTRTVTLPAIASYSGVGLVIVNDSASFHCKLTTNGVGSEFFQDDTEDRFLYGRGSAVSLSHNGDATTPRWMILGTRGTVTSVVQ